MPRSLVAALRVDPERIAERTRELISLVCSTGRPTTTRALFSSASSCDPWAPEGPRPWQLHAALDVLSDAHPVVAARCATPDAERDLMRAILTARGVAFRPAHGDGPRFEVRPTARMLALPKAFPEGILVPCAARDEVAVHLCALHLRGDGCTPAMASVAPWILGRSHHRLAPWYHLALTDVLAIQRQLQPDHLTILDAAPSGYVLASRDPVALDAVCARVAGVDPLSVPCLRAAHDDRAGCADPRDIELAGDPLPRDPWRSIPHLAARPRWTALPRPLRRLVALSSLPERLARLDRRAAHDRCGAPWDALIEHALARPGDR